MPPRSPARPASRPVRGAASERKERRFQERDRRIREEAQRLLLERGLHGFSMDDVAAAIDYSKGTVYQHYTNKEDALVASCADSCAEMACGFESAAAAPATPRARMMGIAEAYCAFVRGKAVSFRSIPLIHAPSVMEKARPERLKAMEAARGRCLSACEGIVHDAVERGDLVLPPGLRSEVVTFGLWALMFGAFMLAELHRPDGVLGITDPVDAIRACWRAQMDGLGWRPLSGDVAAVGRATARREELVKGGKPPHPRGAGTGAGKSTKGGRRNGRPGTEDQR
jgi:AcrR family transcriptional regulator